MLLEKSREITLGAEAEVLGNVADFVVLLAQLADRGLHAKRVGVDARAKPRATAKQMIEVRPRQAGKAGDVVEIDRLGRALAHMS